MKNLLYILIVIAFQVSPLLGVEYWDTYIHTAGVTNFDSDAMLFTPLTKTSAEEKGLYTVVEYDNKSRVTEALSYLNGAPNYYYSYLYEEGKIIYRGMSYFLGDMGETKLLSEIYYNYDTDGNLISTYYYYRNKLKFAKIYNGKSYQTFDYSAKPPSESDKTKELIAEIKELQRLEKRNLLQRLLGL